MKKMMLTLIAMLAIAASACAMSYEQARREALFLTDKMAYELNLTDAQYEAAYEINLDYLMGVTGRHDVFGLYWERRNADLQFILHTWQWEAYLAATYFYRPLFWDAGYWHFGIYARYPHRDYYYFGRPHFYATYRGGHSWRMNGGRSYYQHHRDHFRPAVARESHVGMRDGWNRGDYRSNNGHGNSSTRVTGPTNRGNAGTVDRSGGSRSGNFSGTRNNGSVQQNERSGNFGGTRYNGSVQQNERSGNFGGMRSSGTTSSIRTAPQSRVRSIESATPRLGNSSASRVNTAPSRIAEGARMNGGVVNRVSGVTRSSSAPVSSGRVGGITRSSASSSVSRSSGAVHASSGSRSAGSISGSQRGGGRR